MTHAERVAALHAMNARRKALRSLTDDQLDAMLEAAEPWSEPWEDVTAECFRRDALPYTA